MSSDRYVSQSEPESEDSFDSVHSEGTGASPSSPKRTMSSAGRVSNGGERSDAQRNNQQNRSSALRAPTENFEKSFSEMFASASLSADVVDNNLQSEFYENVRRSLGRLRDRFEVLPSSATRDSGK